MGLLFIAANLKGSSEGLATNESLSTFVRKIRRKSHSSNLIAVRVYPIGTTTQSTFVRKYPI
jgi:hypothetical protein